MRPLLPLLLATIALPLATPAAAQGIESTRDGLTTRVDAIAPDIVRIRIAKGATLPEDASWAVLPSMRTAHATTTKIDGGFSTPALSVTVDPATGAITIRDAAGRTLLADAAPVRFDGDRFTLTKTLTAGEHIFGLGDRTGPADRRGRSFTLWNTDAGITETRDPTYKSIPFFLSIAGEGGNYGLFLDNTYRSWFDFGHRDDKALSFGAEGGPIDYYVIAAPSAAKIVERYTDLTGKPPMLPKWAFGYQQARYSYMSADEVRTLVDRFRTDKFPLDVVWLDIDFQDHNRPFTTNPQTFPDLPKLVSDIGGKGVKLVTITDLHIAKVPEGGYAPYDQGLRQDQFVHNADGSVFSGTVWPGPSVFPDFTRAASRRWWGDLYKPFVEAGIAGFWNDMNEPAVFFAPGGTMPPDAVHRVADQDRMTRTATHAEIHNVFGMQNFRATYEGLQRLRPTERPFVMTRATYAGGQRWATTWTGDNYASWSQLKLATAMTLNLGLSGFAYTAADVGGFSGGAGPDLLTRWFQVAAFTPLFRDHATKGSPPQEPWVHGAEQEAIRRTYVEERYRLFPYFYALSDEAHRTGAPLNRPIWFDDAKALGASCDTSLTFTLGRALAVVGSPFPEQPTAYRGCLPAGRWFDYWTDAEATTQVFDEGVFGKPEALLITPRPDVLPVYVREGTILPKQPLVQSLSETPTGALELHVWPGADCGGTLYDDDGKANGAFRRQRVTCTVAPDGAVTLDVAAAEGRYRPWWKAMNVVVHTWTGNATVRAGRRAVPATAGKALTFQLPATAKATHVTIARR